ncbi:AMP-binding enzyme domain protein [Scedosporium apiospermum]|uniref:AMP-binding enzyme domain protein n=1 Tax=Pseudallescheria apiosperma TaxID=563466 RepID=A0A084GCS5_PSEDA|nr:AMP-binding enzyme domain protein [Scedosporium apiospermum]KEZ45137.1 AMP-binding enzyme domain protein [Scedosporium apiospermum]
MDGAHILGAEFARAINKKYGIKPNDVVSIVAKDKVTDTPGFPSLHLLITDGALLDVSEVASGLIGGVPIITLDKADGETTTLEDLLRQVQPGVATFDLNSHEDAEAHDAFINRTSGSTGTMKSVLISHGHYIAALEGTLRTIPSSTDPSKDVWLASSSLGYLINAKLFMSLNILLGIPVVLMPEPLDETSASIIKRHLITFILIFPPLVAKLAKSNLDPEDVSSIKWLLSAGAVVPENLRRAISTKFPTVELTLEWGTTETMLIAIQISDAVSRRPGSSGTLVNGMQARVISTQTGQDLGPNEPGEILVRNSLARFRGYKDNVEANREFDEDGWFHTGDYGYIDEDCNVYIVDRLKELLRVGDGYGSRISASELENIIFEHPAVHTVVVVGIWDDISATELPTAFVVPQHQYLDRPGSDLAREIEQFVATKLTGLKSLTGGVYFVDSHPTTGFKINRRALKTLNRDPVSRRVVWEDELNKVGCFVPQGGTGDGSVTPIVLPAGQLITS